MIDFTDIKDDFWDLVRSCIVEFHGRTVTEADASIIKYLCSIDHDLVKECYKTEPFYTANDIEDCELAIGSFLYRYERLCDRPEWRCKRCDGDGLDTTSYKLCKPCKGSGNANL